MGRKKVKEKEEEKENSNFNFEIGGDIKKSLIAIFLFSLAVLIFLGFLGKSGILGEFLNNSIGQGIGWLKWILPIFLVLSGLVLLLKEKTSFYIVKIAGLFVILLSLGAIFHWFFGAENMKEAAQAGKGGGYLGYAIALTGINFFGKAGSLVVFLALLLAGSIAAFNFSIISLIQKIIEKIRNKEGEEKSGEIKKEKKREEKSKEENKEENIRNIEFVEGPDQYVSQSLQGMGENNNLDISKKQFRKSYKGRGEADWVFPSLDLLEKGGGEAKGGDLDKNAEIIEKTLHNFGIDVEKGDIKVGPAVTQYSFRPAVGVKVSKIMSLQNDIALALAKHPIRIEAPIPGRSMIGIEIPNNVPALVRMRDILEAPEFSGRESNLTLALGKDVGGEFLYADLDKMPHLLIAGSTGTGKSVAINGIITSLLYQNSPQDLKMIMIDPKRVELSLYNDIPHLLSNVVVENGKVINVLRWAVNEMEERYRLLQDTGSRDIASYNEKAINGKKKKYVNPEDGKTVEEKLKKLHYIVIVVDELADLMGSHGKEVEGAIVRLAQMARAVGIHLIISTQRPSVEVLTGLIKANITTRIAFQVATQIDSRTILDMAGAEKLLGNGDMLYLSSNSPKPKRIQGVFISESEVKRVVKFIKSQKIEEDIEESDLEQELSGGNKATLNAQGKLEFEDVADSYQEDELFEEAKQEVIRAGKGSASLLQRRLRVGYARAARLLDMLEERGIVGPAEGSKPREVYQDVEENSLEIESQEDLENQKENQEEDKWNM